MVTSEIRQLTEALLDGKIGPDEYASKAFVPGGAIDFDKMMFRYERRSAPSRIYTERKPIKGPTEIQ